jgi:hypothetical protein
MPTVDVRSPTTRTAGHVLRRTRVGWPEAVVFAVLGCLVLAHLTIIVIDVVNVGAVGDSIRERGASAAWVHLFGEANPIEWLQWALIGTLIVVSAQQSGQSDALSDRSGRIFWLLIAVGATMMLMEDAGNVRHRLVVWAEMTGVIDAESRMNLLVEAVWFAGIAAVFAWAALRHARQVQFPKRALAYGFFGVAFYAVAVLSSATRDLGDWYERAGAAVSSYIYGGNLALPTDWATAEAHHFFMDYVYEESLELFGAGFLLAASLAFRTPRDPLAESSGDRPAVSLEGTRTPRG